MSPKKTQSPKSIVKGGSLESLINKYQGVNVAAEIYQNVKGLQAIEFDPKEIILSPLYDESLYSVGSSISSPYPAFICNLKDKTKPILFSCVENFIIAKKTKSKIKCYLIKDLSESDIIAFILNDLTKKDNPLFLAVAYKALKDVYSLSYSKLSTLINVSKAQIINLVKLLNLPPLIYDQLKAGSLSYTLARAINGLATDKEKLEIFKFYQEEKLSVRDIERLVREKKKNLKTRKLTTYIINDNKITITCEDSEKAQSLLAKIRKIK